jgi:hypothetical protein
MSTEFELFDGKSLSSLFKDIYNNQVQKKQKISSLIEEIKNMVRHVGDMESVGPIIQGLVDTSVKNDDQLVKLAQIAQKIVSAEKKSEGQEGFLSPEEKAQLLRNLDETLAEVERVDELENEVEELKSKMK